MYKDVKSQQVSIKVTMQQKQFMDQLVQHGKFKNINQLVSTLITNYMILN